jgi:hypothetical protein
VQADPIVAAPFNPQSLNRFAYVLNNPINYIDPSGYAAKCLRPPAGSGSGEDDAEGGDEGGGCGGGTLAQTQPGSVGSDDRETESPEPPKPLEPPEQLKPTESNPNDALPKFISWEVNAIIDPPTWDRDPDPGGGCLVGYIGGLQTAGIRFRNWLAQNLRIGRIINYANTPYPKYIDPRTGTEVPFPKGNLQWIDKPFRVRWTGTERRMFIREWEQQGFSVPPGGWSRYDIHHIHPKEFGGTNDFWNLVPVERGFHQQHFNPWWDLWY